MKMKTSDPDFLKFFGEKTKAIKLKKPRELQKVLTLTQEKINKILTGETPSNETDVENEKTELEKLVQLKYILEKDRFEGLNRKIQMKPL